MISVEEFVTNGFSSEHAFRLSFQYPAAVDVLIKVDSDAFFSSKNLNVLLDLLERSQTVRGPGLNRLLSLAPEKFANGYRHSSRGRLVMLLMENVRINKLKVHFDLSCLN